MPADQHAEIGPGAGDSDCLVVLLEHESRVDTDLVDDSLDELAHLRRKFALIRRRWRRYGFGGHRGDHPSRSEADAEQTTLAF